MGNKEFIKELTYITRRYQQSPEIHPEVFWRQYSKGMQRCINKYGGIINVKRQSPLGDWLEIKDKEGNVVWECRDFRE
jgi:hypothetical protein